MIVSFRDTTLGIALLAVTIVPLSAHAQENLANNSIQVAAATCPSGTVAITDQLTRLTAHMAGIPDSDNCWDPKSPDTGAAVGSAKIYLRSILCAPDKDNYGGAGADGTIQKLNGNFAQCAATFLQAASTQLPGSIGLSNGKTNPVCVREGYRTPEKQQAYYQRYRNGGPVACGPDGSKCEHPLGIAMDVNTIPANYQKLWKLAPQFGLVFYLPTKDPVHFAAKKYGCVSTGGGSQSPPPDTDLPSSTYDFPDQMPAGTPQGPNPFQSTLNSLMQLSTLSNMFKQQQAQSQQPAYPQVAPAPVILPPTVTPPSTSSSLIGSPITLPNGNPITIPNNTGTATGASGSGSSSTSGDTSSNNTPTSALDLILQVAGIDPAAPIHSTSSVTQNGNIQDISQLPTTDTPNGTQGNYHALSQSQIFVSNDLSANAPHASQQLSPADQVRFNSILDRLSLGLSQLAGMIAAPARPFVQLSQWKPATPIFD